MAAGVHDTGHAGLPQQGAGGGRDDDRPRLGGRSAVNGVAAVRPPDPLIQGPTCSVMATPSREAVRRLLNLDFRDCWSVLDLTFGRGNFWREPPPPGIVLTTNNPDP